MNRGTSYRRFQRNKHKKRVTDFVKFSWKCKESCSNPKLIGRMTTTKHPCSCYMCGNPRKYYKGKDRLTLAEQRNLDNFKEQINENTGNRFSQK